jgi:hypothetical protein
MDARTVGRFLIKVFVLLPALLLAWQKLSFAPHYHAVVAAMTGAVYGLVAKRGMVHGVSADTHEFLAHVLVGGQRQVLHIEAADVTSNTCTLLALYLASPIRPLWRKYVGWLSGSMVGLLAIHVFTVIAAIQSAAGLPGMWTRTCAVYLNFYEVVGMYLLVLVMWLPYIAMHARATAEGNRP